MSKIEWRTKRDKYEAIGFLARKGVVQNIEANVPDKFVDRFKKRFKGKYIGGPYPVGNKKGGDQYRITLNHIEGCPNVLKKNIDGKTKKRINDTNFIKELVNDYGFVFSSTEQNGDLIRSIVESIGSKEYGWFKSTYSPEENFIQTLLKSVNVKDKTAKIVGNNDGSKLKTKKKTKSEKHIKNIKSQYFTDDQLLQIGWIGEKYVYNLLNRRDKQLLEKLDVNSEDFEVEWFNNGFEDNPNWQDKSVGKGCDMYLIDGGRKLFLEVKSSRRAPGYFAVTNKELQIMNKYAETYYLLKLNYLDKVINSGQAELRVYKNPFKKFFEIKRIKEIVFLTGDEENE